MCVSTVQSPCCGSMQRGVEVALKDQSTACADEGTIRQGVLLVDPARAGLGGRGAATDHLECGSSELRLVGKWPPEVVEAKIGHGTAETPDLEQALHMQAPLEGGPW